MLIVCLVIIAVLFIPLPVSVSANTVKNALKFGVFVFKIPVFKNEITVNSIIVRVKSKKKRAPATQYIKLVKKYAHVSRFVFFAEIGTEYASETALICSSIFIFATVIASRVSKIENTAVSVTPFFNEKKFNLGFECIMWTATVHIIIAAIIILRSVKNGQSSNRKHNGNDHGKP